jgi:hypothetical protein
VRSSLRCSLRCSLAAVSLLVLVACRTVPVQMTPNAERVVVGRSDPADNYQMLGGLTARDGNGCGLIGRRGTLDNALVALRVKAADMGADYVSIVAITEPHQEGEHCFANPYVISGVAYRKTAVAPSPVAVQPVAASPGDAGLVEKLRELSDLHRAGALTDEEFARAKAKLLE